MCFMHTPLMFCLFDLSHLLELQDVIAHTPTDHADYQQMVKARDLMVGFAHRHTHMSPTVTTNTHTCTHTRTHAHVHTLDVCCCLPLLSPSTSHLSSHTYNGQRLMFATCNVHI